MQLRYFYYICPTDVTKSHGLSFFGFWRLAAAHLFYSFSTHQPNKRIQGLLIFFRALFAAWPCTKHAQQHQPTLPPASHGARNVADLSCIPWSPLKSVPDATDMWIPCACALLRDFPKPTQAQQLHKGLHRQQCCPCAPAFSQPGFTLGHTSWAAKTSESGKESPAWNDVSLASQTCGKERSTKSSFPISKIHHWNLTQQQCFRSTKGTCHDLGSPSSTGKICPFFLQLQGKDNGHPLPHDPELCFTARRETSACPELYRPVLFEMETKEQEMATNTRLPRKTHVAPSDQSLPWDVTVPPWYNFHPELPPPHGMLLT